MPVNVGQVPGTTIVVDGFRPPHKVENTFFLSHFHADHYTGLNGSKWSAGYVCSASHSARDVCASRWSKATSVCYGASAHILQPFFLFDRPIYCSEITARLLELELEVDPKWIVPLTFDDEHNVAGATIVLVDANHCTCVTTC